jgi:hypothetical protein
MISSDSKVFSKFLSSTFNQTASLEGNLENRVSTVLFFCVEKEMAKG